MRRAQTVAYVPPEADTGSGQLTVAGQVLGTPAYMAPEQARGEVELLGPAADIYALGRADYDLLKELDRIDDRMWGPGHSSRTVAERNQPTCSGRRRSRHSG